MNLVKILTSLTLSILLPDLLYAQEPNCDGPCQVTSARVNMTKSVIIAESYYHTRISQVNNTGETQSFHLVNNTNSSISGISITRNINGPINFMDAISTSLPANGEMTIDMPVLALNALGFYQEELIISPPAPFTGDTLYFNFAVTPDTFSVVTGSHVSSLGFSPITFPGKFGFLVKYHAGSPTYIKGVEFRVGNSASNIGRKVAAVLLNSNKQIVHESKTKFIFPNETGGDKFLPLIDSATTSIVPVHGDYYLGIIQQHSNSSETQFFPQAFDNEMPPWSDKYFTGPIGSTITSSLQPRRLFNKSVAYVVNASGNLGPVSLVAPANNVNINFATTHSHIEFRWASTPINFNEQIRYYLQIDLAQGTYAPPIYEVLSGNNGADTTLKLHSSFFDGSLLGIPPGVSLPFEWRVVARAGILSSISTPRNFNLTYGQSTKLCDSTTGTNDFMYIQLIDLDNQTKISGKNPTGPYSNYFDTDSFTVDRNNPVFVSVELNYQPFNAIGQMAVDWNKNGVFEPLEITNLLGGTPDTANQFPPIFFSTLTVPSFAANGTYRIRFAAGYSAAPFSLCNPVLGEIEDYKLIVTNSTGLPEAKPNEPSLSIFPNPAYDKVNLVLNDGSQSEGLLIVFDLAGNIVYSEKNFSGTAAIGHLKAGCYIVDFNGHKSKLIVQGN